MVKCVDCGKHVKEGNRCLKLEAVLSFPPDSEAVCPDFEPKPKEKPKTESK